MIVDLHLRGRLVIVVGAGREGMRKVEALLGQDCEILLVAEEFGPAAEARAAEGRVTLERARLDGAGFLERRDPYVVMAATDDRALNRAISEKARASGCLAYAADDPDCSDFAHPSIASAGGGTVQVAVSTGGRSPAMAGRIRRRLEGILAEAVTDEDVLHIRLQEAARREAKAAIGAHAERRRYLYAVMADGRVKRLIKQGDLAGARRRAMEILGGWGDRGRS